MVYENNLIKEKSEKIKKENFEVKESRMRIADELDKSRSKESALEKFYKEAQIKIAELQRQNELL